MKNRLLAVFFVMTLMFCFGCAKKAVILSPDSDIPHSTLGTLEVATSAHPCTITKLLSFGLLKPGYVGIQNKLDRKLAHEAVSKFDADGITNIQYWPEAGVKTADGKIHARADMVTFLPFPESSAPSKSSPQ